MPQIGGSAEGQERGRPRGKETRVEEEDLQSANQSFTYSFTQSELFSDSPPASLSSSSFVFVFSSFFFSPLPSMSVLPSFFLLVLRERQEEKSGKNEADRQTARESRATPALPEREGRQMAPYPCRQAAKEKLGVKEW